jgi:hypothetical protein
VGQEGHFCLKKFLFKPTTVGTIYGQQGAYVDKCIQRLTVKIVQNRGEAINVLKLDMTNGVHTLI